jgi:hypothetical protein
MSVKNFLHFHYPFMFKSERKEKQIELDLKKKKFLTDIKVEIQNRLWGK